MEVCADLVSLPHRGRKEFPPHSPRRLRRPSPSGRGACGRTTTPPSKINDFCHLPLHRGGLRGCAGGGSGRRGRRLRRPGRVEDLRGRRATPPVKNQRFLPPPSRRGACGVCADLSGRSKPLPYGADRGRACRAGACSRRRGRGTAVRRWMRGNGGLHKPQRDVAKRRPLRGVTPQCLIFNSPFLMLPVSVG